MTHWEKIKYRDLVRAVNAYEQHLKEFPNPEYLDPAAREQRQVLWAIVRERLAALGPAV